MTALTDWRIIVQNTLAAALAPMSVVAGYVDGPLEDGDLCCVYPDGTREWGDDVDVEISVIRVRLIKKYARSTNPRVPIDPSDIEQLAETAKQALTPVQTSAGPWFFRVAASDFDARANICELTVEARAQNTFG